MDTVRRNEREKKLAKNKIHTKLTEYNYTTFYFPSKYFYMFRSAKIWEMYQKFSIF